MTCRHVGQLRDNYLDGELSSSLTAEIHAHLLQCSACREQMEMLRACGDVIAKDNEVPALDEGFASRVMASLPTRELAEPVVATTIEFEQVSATQRILKAAWMPALAAMLFLTVLIWPTTDVDSKRPTGSGVVAGTSVTAADLGTRQMAEPALDSINSTRSALRDVSDVVSLSVEQVGESLQQGIDKKAPTTEDATFSVLDILFAPMEMALTPDDQPTESKEENIVRF